MSHPRALTDIVRRQDTSRKDSREKRKERKETEKEKWREEVKRLKALKMRGIKEKIEKIEKEAGGKGLKREVLQELEGDLDDEWDPAKHDAHMQKLYDDNDFYGVEVRVSWRFHNLLTWLVFRMTISPNGLVT
jgi:protein KRI1